MSIHLWNFWNTFCTTKS